MHFVTDKGDQPVVFEIKKFISITYQNKSVILISASLLFLGSALRNAASERHLLPLLFVGQFIGQFSRAIALPYAGSLANLWFKPNEISKAVGIGTSGFTLGTALGYVIPGRVPRINPTDIFVIESVQS